MVYTITFNPSLDYIVDVNNFTTGVTNRTSSETMLPGGKGLNVSIVLNNLGIDTTAVYFSAGFVGDEINRLLEDYGIKTHEIRLSKGCSRINVKLNSPEGTEINGMGPDISPEDMDRLWSIIEDIEEGDFLVLAGSVPSSVPRDIYSRIMERLDGKGVNIVVDATGMLLVDVLKHHPFLIKPNNHEIKEIFDSNEMKEKVASTLPDLSGKEIEKRENITSYAKELAGQGARNVVVSMAGAGAVFVDEYGNVHERKAPEGTVVNAVGAGDSMVAGFVAGYIEKHNYEHAFKMGLAAGSSSAFSDHLTTKKELEDVMKSME